MHTISVKFPKEIEFLKLLIEGHHKKTAAREMNVLIRLKNIYEKIQVHSKTEAAAKILRERSV